MPVATADNPSIIGGKQRIVYDASAGIPSGFTAGGQTSQQLMAQNAPKQQPAQPVPATAQGVDALGAKVPTGVSPLPVGSIPGKYGAYVDTAYYNYGQDNQIIGLTIQEKGRPEMGEFGKTTFIPKSELVAEREKYYAEEKGTQDFLADNPYGMSTQTGYVGFGKNPILPGADTTTISIPIQTGAGLVAGGSVLKGTPAPLYNTRAELNTYASQIALEQQRLQNPAYGIPSYIASLGSPAGASILTGGIRNLFFGGKQDTAFEVAEQNVRFRGIRETQGAGGVLNYMVSQEAPFVGKSETSLAKPLAEGVTVGAAFGAVGSLTGGFLSRAPVVGGAIQFAVKNPKITEAVGTAAYLFAPENPVYTGVFPAGQARTSSLIAQGVSKETAQQRGGETIAQGVVSGVGFMKAAPIVQENFPLTSGQVRVPVGLAKEGELPPEKTVYSAIYERGSSIPGVNGRVWVGVSETGKVSFLPKDIPAESMPSLKSFKPPLQAEGVSAHQGGFLPRTELEANVLLRPTTTKAMGLSAAQGQQLRDIYTVTQLGGSVKSAYMDISYPPTTKAYGNNPKGVATTTAGVNFLEQTAGQISKAGGSYFTGPKMAPEVERLGGDLDLTLKTSSPEQAAAYAKAYASSVNKAVPGARIKVSAEGKPTGVDLHYQGEPEQPYSSQYPNLAFGKNLDMPAERIPGSRIPTATMAEQTARKASAQGIWSTPEGRLSVEPGLSRGKDVGDTLRAGYSQLQSAKATKQLAPEDIMKLNDALTRIGDYPYKTPGAKEGVFEARQAMAEGKGPSFELDVPKTATAPKVSDLRAGSLSDVIGSGAVNTATTAARGLNFNLQSGKPVGSVKPLSPPSMPRLDSGGYSPSGKPSPSSPSTPPSGQPYVPPSGGSSWSQISNYFGGSSSSSSSSSSYTYSPSYSYSESYSSYAPKPGTIPFFGMPAIPGGSSGVGRRRFGVVKSAKASYRPSLAGMLSGRTVAKAGRNLTGAEIRYPVASQPRRGVIHRFMPGGKRRK